MSKSTVKFEPNIPGFNAFRQSEPVAIMIEQVARDRMNAFCGDGYEMKMGNGSTRSRATIWTEEYEAVQDNYDNNTLERVIGK